MEIGPRLAALTLFVRRLEARSPISATDRDAVMGLSGQPQKVHAHRDIVRLGETVDQAFLIVEGIVARFAQLEDGSRQIVSMHVPGDMVDLYSLLLPQVPSPLHALTNATVMRVPHAALRRLAFEHHGLAIAFWRDCVVDGGIIAQWLVNVGRKDARSRIAHLLCEMAVRHAQIGGVRNGSFPFSITQEQIGDALGLTSVHVNRSVKTLRESGVIEMSRSGVTIRDWRGLVSIAEFDPTYLHMPAAAETLDAARRYSV